MELYRLLDIASKSRPFHLNSGNWGDSCGLLQPVRSELQTQKHRGGASKTTRGNSAIPGRRALRETNVADFSLFTKLITRFDEFEGKLLRYASVHVIQVNVVHLESLQRRVEGTFDSSTIGLVAVKRW